MIIGTIKVEVHPNKRLKFVQTVQALAKEIRKEKGSQGCYFYQDVHHCQFWRDHQQKQITG